MQYDEGVLDQHAENYFMTKQRGSNWRAKRTA
jgi:hypothetical protein